MHLGTHLLASEAGLSWQGRLDHISLDDMAVST